MTCRPRPRSTAISAPAGRARSATRSGSQVDLGAPATINRVVINWETAYAHGFQIQTSADGTPLDDDQHHHDGHGRRPDPQRVRLRPVRAAVHAPCGPASTALAVGVPGLRHRLDRFPAECDPQAAARPRPSPGDPDPDDRPSATPTTTAPTAGWVPVNQATWKKALDAYNRSHPKRPAESCGSPSSTPPARSQRVQGRPDRLPRAARRVAHAQLLRQPQHQRRTPPPTRCSPTAHDLRRRRGTTPPTGCRPCYERRRGRSSRRASPCTTARGSRPDARRCRSRRASG